MRSRGFTLVEMMVVLVLIGISSVGIARWLEREAQRQIESSVAQHGLQVAEAASAWAKDNYATIIANTTAGGTDYYTLTVDALKDDSYLAPGFQPISPIGQTYTIRFRQPTAGTISGLMIAAPASGGTVPDDLSLRRIARQMGAPGGYVESSRAAGTSASRVDGALGAWSVDASSWGWTAIPGGSLAFSLFFSQAESTGDFVYRRPVPGRPELNRMEAPLDMGDQPITNVGGIDMGGRPITNASAITASTITGMVVLTAAPAGGGSCSPSGALAAGGVTGIMLCKNGMWRPLAISN